MLIQLPIPPENPLLLLRMQRALLRSSLPNQMVSYTTGYPYNRYITLST